MPDEKKAINNLPEPMDLPASPPIVEDALKEKKNKKTSDKESAGEAAAGSLEELMRQNIKWCQEIYNQNKKIKKRLTVMAVGSYVKLVLIIAPIVLAILYLPPLLEKMLGSFNGLFGATGGGADLGDILGTGFNFNLNDILSNLSPEQIEAAEKAIGQMPE